MEGGADGVGVARFEGFPDPFDIELGKKNGAALAGAEVFGGDVADEAGVGLDGSEGGEELFVGVGDFADAVVVVGEEVGLGCGTGLDEGVDPLGVGPGECEAADLSGRVELFHGADGGEVDSADVVETVFLVEVAVAFVEDFPVGDGAVEVVAEDAHEVDEEGGELGLEFFLEDAVGVGPGGGPGGDVEHQGGGGEAGGGGCEGGADFFDVPLGLGFVEPFGGEVAVVEADEGGAEGLEGGVKAGVGGGGGEEGFVVVDAPEGGGDFADGSGPVDGDGDGVGGLGGVGVGGGEGVGGCGVGDAGREDGRGGGGGVRRGGGSGGGGVGVGEDDAVEGDFAVAVAAHEEELGAEVVAGVGAEAGPGPFGRFGPDPVAFFLGAVFEGFELDGAAAVAEVEVDAGGGVGGGVDGEEGLPGFGVGDGGGSGGGGVGDFAGVGGGVGFGLQEGTGGCVGDGVCEEGEEGGEEEGEE